MSEALPFQRGQTMFGGAPDASTDGNGILGQEYKAVYELGGTKRSVILRAVRNSSGVTVHGKKLAKLNALGTAILGLGIADGEQRVAPIDEYLPTGGCAANDICYVVVQGPAVCLTQVAVADANVIAAGDLVNVATINVTSGATTAGRLKSRVLSSSVTANTAELIGVFGRAISSIATSGVTATDCLVDVDVAF